MKIKDVLLALALLINGIALGIVVGRCSVGGEEDTLSVRVDSFRDTMYVEVHDTVPMIKHDTVIKRIPVSDFVSQAGNSSSGGVSDSVDIVQREYSDDSTYTAWVSGVRYAEWPKLDSISVRQREITRTIKETITLQRKASRFSVGIVGGYGYGFAYKGFEPFIGVGVSYKITP